MKILCGIDQKVCHESKEQALKKAIEISKEESRPLWVYYCKHCDCSFDVTGAFTNKHHHAFIREAIRAWSPDYFLDGDWYHQCYSLDVASAFTSSNSNDRHNAVYAIS